ncbi:MAG: bifunctional 23S rRNA (guanine(2069)-N(7))-methyltransferase RlmK/23S rRNA (guanine(2445)-N(2))-methyltransferase RlmL, partial [Coriobacteriales bacterium]|nr:bifunctional 23S rRNA (guanine(2069)-N(7))-methyltransferase RlmK/23S rRNA (guanine(2445)-N(2))-methyltransferase RlmL [Coriobacteriales bacterium]
MTDSRHGRQTADAALEFFAPCPQGLEGVCAAELKQAGIHRVRPLKSGVAFFGDLEAGYRACLWSRTASRVLLMIDRIDAADADALYAGAKAIAWERHLSVDSSFAVDASGTNDALRNTQYTGMRLKDALCDRFRELEGRRPNVDSAHPDVLINVALRGQRATVSIDLAGGSLHRRGYRKPGKQAAAPLKEALAAGMLLLADWPRIAREGGALLDPFCGSGTLCIEAALIAGDVAPGILRPHWGFEGWAQHDAALWERLLDEADARAEAGRAQIPPIMGSDIDPAAIQLAQDCVNRAGLAGCITLSVQDACDLQAPAGVKPGLIVCNPPYGERMSSRAQLPALYAGFASCVRSRFDGWQLAIISSDPALDSGLGMEPQQLIPLFNGRIESPLHLYGSSTQQPELLEGTAQFVARIKKMYAHRRKWARKQGIGCYRLYDADLPDYNMAIDIYVGAGPDDGQTWAQVYEYAAPAHIDAAKAARRLSDALRVLPQVLEIPVDHVFSKQRRRAKGGSQYADEAASGESVRAYVEEYGLVFEVDMASYL